MRPLVRQALVFAFVFVATPALADRIDGDWCNGRGARLHIEGPRLHTPSGRMVIGEYTRHTFRYIGPHGENDEGAEIRMIQRSDQEMTLFRGRSAREGETWRRCNLSS